MTAKAKLVKAQPLGWWESLYLPLVQGFLVTLRHLFSRKVTLEYPEVQRPLPKRFRGKHRLNKDAQGREKCVACYLCSTACPAECIYIEAEAAPWPDREKRPKNFSIDTLKCIYCGYCELACPEDAIQLVPRMPGAYYDRLEGLKDKARLLGEFDETSAVVPTIAQKDRWRT